MTEHFEIECHCSLIGDWFVWRNRWFRSLTEAHRQSSEITREHRIVRVLRDGQREIVS